MSMEVKNLNIGIEDKQIINNLNFSLEEGKITVIMGPNGSGKSTLAQGLMGHPQYSCQGSVNLGSESESENLLEMEADQRSKAGLFLSFQYPVEIDGVTVNHFLRQAVNARREKPIRISEFKRLVNEYMEILNINPNFLNRYLNKGFSGGEKKKMEILQLLLLQPKVAILDETDSGLDVDALKQVCVGINKVKELNPQMSILLITHYQRILNYLDVDKVIILKDGVIKKEGGHELVEQIENQGYEAVVNS